MTDRKNAEFVKIGTTRRASARFSALSSTGRVRLLVAEPGDSEQEAFRHTQFASLRTPGTELFLYTRQLIDHIAELRNRYPTYRDLTDVGRSYD